jgi:hypothetical protein
MSEDRTEREADRREASICSNGEERPVKAAGAEPTGAFWCS